MKHSEHALGIRDMWEEICGECVHSLFPKTNDYPVCKEGRFREVDIENRLCLHREVMGPVARL